MRIEITNTKTLQLVLAIVGMLAFASAPAAPKDFELHQAVLDNDLQLVKQFLGLGADVNLIGSRRYGYGSALHLAVREGHLDMAKLLLDRGARVDVLDPDDFTPLHNAAWNGNLEMTQLLLDAGADIEASTYDGDTPLTLAQNNNQPKVAEYIQAKLQPATSQTKAVSKTVSDPGTIDISGSYKINEFNYPDEVIKSWYSWYFGKGDDMVITIEQNGADITGVISGESKGKINGELKGNEVNFEFDVFPPSGGQIYGPATWNVSDDGSELSGTWLIKGTSYGRIKGSWKFSKIEAEPAQVVDISGTYISEITGSGALSGFMKRKIRKEITLEQTGNAISGSDGSKSFKIFGTREGNAINYYVITTTNEINGDWEINADATILEGKWFTDGGGGGSGIWNLTRIE